MRISDWSSDVCSSDLYDPKQHLALGRALAPLRDENILIIGSGLSYHNLRQIYGGGSAASAQFDAWLQKVLLGSPIEQRAALLADWENAPAARLAHPREDHLIPLMVADRKSTRLNSSH